MGYSHTSLRTWTSRGTRAITRPSTTCPTHLSMGLLPYLAEHLDEQRHLCEPDHPYLSISSTDGISPIPRWEPGWAEVPVKRYGKCLLVISPSQGGIRSPLLQVFLESIQTSIWKRLSENIYNLVICTISPMKLYRISMCFDLSWNTRFTDICTQIWLSQGITIGSGI